MLCRGEYFRYFNLGCLFLEAKDWAKAVAIFDKCTEIDPQVLQAPWDHAPREGEGEVGLRSVGEGEVGLR